MFVSVWKGMHCFCKKKEVKVGVLKRDYEIDRSLDKMKFSGLRSVIIKIMARIIRSGYKIFKNMHNIFFFPTSL